jgi:hypothetical protein
MRKNLATTIVMLGLLLMAVVPAGAAASTPGRAPSDLSSLPAIEAYLVSIGVDPGSVVIQRGPLNYAGPNCPGDGWNCTAATRVVQLSNSPTAMNVFDCQPALNALAPALNECLIVQSSADDPFETASTTNSASCDADLLAGSGKAKCKIRQSSKKGSNYAEVSARITQRGAALPQSATEEADITQMSDGGRNTARITQRIDQLLNIGEPEDPTQPQQARQTASITQTSGSGNNSADLQQTSLQVENAESNQAITQEQNQNVGSPGANQDATIKQTSTSGNNWANLAGQLTQRQAASCGSCLITQREGVLDGGQKGEVDQSTVSGTTNQGAGTQVEDQRQDADSSTPPIQSKNGPQDCCLDQAGGGSGNRGTVILRNVQIDNQGPQASGVSTQTGDCHAALGQECTVDLTYDANGTTHHFNQTAPFVTHTRMCDENHVEGNVNFCDDDPAP